MISSFLARRRLILSLTAAICIIAPPAAGQRLVCNSEALAQAPGETTVRVSPTDLQVVVGETQEAAVEVIDVDELYGLDISLTFDPQVVEVVDADPDQSGVQVAFGTFLDPGFVIENSADNDQGTVRFAMTQLNPSQAKSGTGPLIVIQLLGKQVGSTTPLTLVDAQLAQRDGTRLTTTLVSGQVNVVASGTGGPTNTPIPTQEPRLVTTPSPSPPSLTTTPSPTTNSTPAPSGEEPTPSPSPRPPTTTPRPTTTNNTPAPTVRTAETATADQSASEKAKTVTPSLTATTTREPSNTETPVVVAAGGSETPRGQTPTIALAATRSAEPGAGRSKGPPSWLRWLAVALLVGAGSLFALALYLKLREQTTRRS